MTEYKNLLDTITEGRTLPEGFDTWGIKSTRPDLTTRGGYRWPFPGNTATAPDMADHNDPCPRFAGDGLCVALDWNGMASGGFPARTLLLVAYRASEAHGNRSKVRVPAVHVVALVDGEALIRASGTRANLYGANLSGANLSVANLRGADLDRANLRGALNIPASAAGGLR